MIIAAAAMSIRVESPDRDKLIEKRFTLNGSWMSFASSPQ